MNCKTLILIVSVLVGISGTPVPEKDFTKIAAATYERSSRECSDPGAGYGLPVYQGDKNIKRIEKAMSDQQITETWLPLKRRKFDVWMWVDGKPVGHIFAKQPWRDYMDCGLFHNRDKAVEVDNCTLDHLGYICEFNGTCTASRESQSTCIDHQGRALIYGCSVENWYDARFQCKRKGMDLAIIRDQKTKQIIHDQWYVSNRKPCYLFWIGLVREYWVYNATGVTEDKSFKPYWAPGFPNKTHDCAVIAKDAEQRRYFWRSSGCNVERPALCLQNQEYEFVTPKPPQEADPAMTTGAPPTARSENKAGLAVGLIFLFLILIVAGIAVYQRKWIMTKIDEIRNARKEKAEGDEETLLMDNKPPLPRFTERFDISGGSYKCPNYDVTLDVPQGALEVEAEITVEPKMDVHEFDQNTPEGHMIIAPIIKIKSTGLLHKYITATVKHFVAFEMKRSVNVYQRLGDTREKHGDWSEVPQEKQGERNTHCKVLDDKLEISLQQTEQIAEFLITCKIEGPARLNLKASVFGLLKDAKTDSNEPLEVEILTTIFHSFYSVSSIIKEHLKQKIVELESSSHTGQNEEKTHSRKESKQIVIHAADLPLKTPSQLLEAHDELEIAVFDIKEEWNLIGTKATSLRLEKLLTGKFPWTQATSTFIARHKSSQQEPDESRPKEPGDFNLEFAFALHKPKGYKGFNDYTVTTTKSSIKIPVTQGVSKLEAEVLSPIHKKELQGKAAHELKKQTTKDTSAADILKKEEENPYDTIDPAMMDKITAHDVGTGTTLDQPQSSRKEVSPIITKAPESAVKEKQSNTRQEVKIDHDHDTVVKRLSPEGKLSELAKDEHPPTIIPPKRVNFEEVAPTTSAKLPDAEVKPTIPEEIGSGSNEPTKPLSQAEQMAEQQPVQAKSKTAKEIKAEKKKEEERRKSEEKEQKLQREREKKEEQERRKKEGKEQKLQLKREKKEEQERRKNEEKEQKLQLERKKKEEKERAAMEKKEKKKSSKGKMTSRTNSTKEHKEIQKEADTTGLLAGGQEPGTAQPGDVQQEK